MILRLVFKLMFEFRHYKSYSYVHIAQFISPPFENPYQPITKAKYAIEYLEEDFLESLEEGNLAINPELFISGENPFLVNVSKGIKTGGK